MTIGVKLDLGFRTDDSYRRLFGARDVLRHLKSLGVRAVETAVDRDTDFSSVAGHIRVCTDAGFRVSLHPYSEGTLCNPARFSESDEHCRQFHTRVFMAAEDAAVRQGCKAIVNIHGAADHRDKDRRALLEESIRFFKWSREWCTENAPHVAVVAELQYRPDPDEGIQRKGDGYEEVLAIARRADVGCCLDLGHAYMNAARFGVELDPPADFLRRVRHIHCHDADKIDHRPLVYGRVPCERVLLSAIRHGFDGAVVLEVPPKVFIETGGLDSLVQSIHKLKTISAAAA